MQPYTLNYHTYAYKAERWCTCPYTIIAFSVNGYVSLTGYHEFTPLLTCHVIQSTIEITALKTTYRSMITASTDIDRFIIQMSAISSRRSYNGRDASPTMTTIITTRGRDYSIRQMRETEYDRDIESNTIPTSQLRPIISQRSYHGPNASPAMMTILS